MTPSTGRRVARPAFGRTDNFFQVFGVQPMLGRTFLPGEQQEGKNDIVVLSYEAWQKYFNGDRSRPGQSVKLDGRASTVIGVMPQASAIRSIQRNAIYIPRTCDQCLDENAGRALAAYRGPRAEMA